MNKVLTYFMETSFGNIVTIENSSPPLNIISVQIKFPIFNKNVYLAYTVKLTFDLNKVKISSL